MSLFSNTGERQALMAQAGEAWRQQLRNDDLLAGAKTDAIGALGSGFDAARGSYGDAIKLYDPYVQAGQNALGVYQGSLGLGGQAGYDSAVGAFHTSPGFEKRVNLATDAVARQASATGALGSGNTMQAVTDRAYDLGDQEYTGWQQNLAGLGQMGLTATGQQAGLTKGIGDLYAGEGQAKSGVYTGLAGLGVGANNQTAGLVSGAWNNYSNHIDDVSKNTWGLGIGALTGLSSLGGLAKGMKAV